MVLIPPGDALIQLCQQARHDIVLIAPFIKVRVIDQLLQTIDSSVEVICITRWLPSDIMAGVSDLDVFKVVKNYSGKLWLRQDLHAKYYRGDHAILIGSANLTNSALGWSQNSNLEILVQSSTDLLDILQFEEHVMAHATLVDDDLYNLMIDASAHWQPTKELRIADWLNIEPLSLADVNNWIPSLRDPNDLFPIYQGISVDDLPELTRDAGIRDIAFLQLPLGLPYTAFIKAVRATLLSSPIINMIDHKLKLPQRFGAIRTLLHEHFDISISEASRASQTLIRWLRYFFPERYEYTRPGYSEIIRRVATTTRVDSISEH